MVLGFHQCNAYIKRKVRVWRVQKYIPLIGAKTSLTCAGLKTTPSHVSQYRVENGNLRKSGSTFCHGTVFAPKQCLYEKEAKGMESPKMYSYCRCKNLNSWCKNSIPAAGLQTTLSQVSQYRAEHGNLRKSGSTFGHSTVFAPKQCLCQKESTGMDSQKMYSPCQCKNVIYMSGTANDPISRKPV